MVASYTVSYRRMYDYGDFSCAQFSRRVGVPCWISCLCPNRCWHVRLPVVYIHPWNCSDILFWNAILLRREIGGSDAAMCFCGEMDRSPKSPSAFGGHHNDWTICLLYVLVRSASLHVHPSFQITLAVYG